MSREYSPGFVLCVAEPIEPGGMGEHTCEVCGIGIAPGQRFVIGPVPLRTVICTACIDSAARIVRESIL